MPGNLSYRCDRRSRMSRNHRQRPTTGTTGVRGPPLRFESTELQSEINERSDNAGGIAGAGGDARNAPPIVGWGLTDADGRRRQDLPRVWGM
jgi:hypothetical protein